MPYTDAQLLDMVTPMRQDRWRFDLLDPALRKLREVQVRKDSIVSVSVDTTRTIIRSMEGLKLDARSEKTIDTFTARLRPVMILSNGSEYPLGVFLFADASRKRFTFGSELDGTLVDLTMIVDQGWPEGTSFPAGFPITEAMRLLASRVGVPALSIEPSTLTLSAPVTWSTGTTTYKAMSDLATLAGYLRPYFDRSGVLVFRSTPAFFHGTPDVTYGAGGRILAESILDSDDLLTAPNRYVAVANNPSSAPIVGIYDVPPSAPHSFANRGFYVTKTIQAQGLTDSVAAQEAARAAAYSDPSTFQHVTFQGTPDPRHDVFDIVRLLDVNYWEVSWKLALAEGGPMQHALRRPWAG